MTGLDAGSRVGEVPDSPMDIGFSPFVAAIFGPISRYHCRLRATPTCRLDLARAGH